jgi:hypothetical protein|tara:strand:- start:222 stop:548 length:327 start_codon:yes stop_codon:yes gene_type:complete
MPKRKKKVVVVTDDQEPSKLLGTIDNPYGCAVCEHGMVSYKDLDKLNEKLSEGIRLRDGTIDRLSRSNAFLTGMMSDWKEAQKNNIKKINDREEKWEKELEEAYKIAT